VLVPPAVGVLVVAAAGVVLEVAAIKGAELGVGTAAAMEGASAGPSGIMVVGAVSERFT
jgi:hypothetical protein